MVITVYDMNNEGQRSGLRSTHARNTQLAVTFEPVETYKIGVKLSPLFLDHPSHYKDNMCGQYGGHIFLLVPNCHLFKV
jgi:hypothetical protein